MISSHLVSSTSALGYETATGVDSGNIVRVDAARGTFTDLTVDDIDC